MRPATERSAEARRQVRLTRLREIARLLCSVADPNAKVLFATALLLIVAAAILAATAPLILQLTIDSLARGRTDAGALLSWATGGLIGAYAISQLLHRACSELRAFVYGTAEQRIYGRLRRRVFARLLALPARFHMDRKTGGITQSVYQGLAGCQLVLQHCIVTALPVIVELATVCVVLVHVGQPQFIGILAGASICYVLTFWYGARAVATPARAVSRANVEAHALLTDSLLNYETIKCFNAEAIVDDLHAHAIIDAQTQWRRLYGRKAAVGLLVALIFSVSMGAALLAAGNAVMRGELSVGTFVLIQAYTLQLVRPLEALGSGLRDITQGLSFLEELLALLRAPIEDDEPLERAVRHKQTGIIRFEGVRFGYDPARTVLRGVDITIPAGKTTALVGASGCGKSSLVRLLLRFYAPSAGGILLDGVPIQEMPRSLLRAMIAVVPQDTVLFNDTIARNIGIGMPGCAHFDIERAARLAHLHSFITGLPYGYDTRVGERGLKLSGGERQRIAIARAVLKNPLVYVFDEATSSLDSRTERAILQELIEVSSGHTTLLIAHRLSTVAYADQIAVIDEGRIIECGTHGELLMRDGQYAGLWRAQNGVEAA